MAPVITPAASAVVAAAVHDVSFFFWPRNVEIYNTKFFLGQNTVVERCKGCEVMKILILRLESTNCMTLSK